jgi:hypothetical protein
MKLDPELNIAGVYRLNVTPALVAAQFAELYGYEMTPAQTKQAMIQCNEQLKSVVLIELLVSNPDERFSLRDFTQPQNGVPQDSWQAAYNETYLTFNGESVIKTKFNELPTESCYRCAFFFHFFDDEAPLRTSYGDLDCPAAESMPERLERLAPFIVVD